jgi:hypothetical protein
LEKQRQNVKTMTTSKRYRPRGSDRRILAQKYPVTFVSYKSKTDKSGK